MKIKKSLFLLAIVAIAVVLVANAGFASDNSDLKSYDFDSFFKMDVPNDANFEKSEGNTTENITKLVNYIDNDNKINIVYAESVGAKDDLVKYYEEMSQNDPFVEIKTVNNTTVVHFGDENTIGDIQYHDMAIAGDNDRYVMIQCDDEDLINSMATSIKFN